MFTLANVALSLLAGSYLAQGAPLEKRQTCQAIDYVVNGGFEQGTAPWALNNTETDYNSQHSYSKSGGGGGSNDGSSSAAGSAGGGGGSSSGGAAGGGGGGGGGKGGSSSATIGKKLKGKRQAPSSSLSISSPGAPASGSVVASSGSVGPAAGNYFYQLVLADDSYLVTLYENVIQATPYGGSYTLSFQYNFINVTGNIDGVESIGYLYLTGVGQQQTTTTCSYSYDDNSGSAAAAGAKRSSSSSCTPGSCDDNSGCYSPCPGPSCYDSGSGASGGGSSGGGSGGNATSTPKPPTHSATPLASPKAKRQASSGPPTSYPPYTSTTTVTIDLDQAHEIKGHKDSSSWKSFEADITLPSDFSLQQLGIGIDLYQKIGITFGFDQISFVANC